MASTDTKTTRIELRARERTAQRLRYAARLAQQSVSTFMLSAAEDRAEEVIARASVTVVPSRFFDELWTALDAPARPSAALARRSRSRRRVSRR